MGIRAPPITGPKLFKKCQIFQCLRKHYFMSEFRTILNTPRSAPRMAISDRIFTIGSCFSDAIGERLATYKLDTYANRMGVLYNPLSIHRVLQMAIHEGTPDELSFVSGERTFHYDFHSSLHASSKTSLQETLSRAVRDCRQHLQRASWLIITYGTAWVYQRKDTGEVVANCHKQPASMFTKRLLTTSEIESSFSDLAHSLKTFNPSLKLILTVSPVRHLRDSIEGNTVSKSVVRIACDNVVRQHANVSYFPAYEIMMDDLRDYRFYKADMIHPNEVAEDYIWEKFTGAWFDDRLSDFIGAWKGILQALQHRPFHPDTSAHRTFLKSTLQRIDTWSGYVDVEEERKQILQQLIES